jgi:hypothetical protein
MTKPLQTASIAAPGFYGLNTQESGITLDSGFALEATNCIIDRYGRLGARKGWQFLAEEADINLLGMHRFVDIDGAEYFGCWSDTSFYIYSSGTLTEVTYNGSQNITDGGWQPVTLNDKAFLFQSGYEPLYFNTVGGGSIEDISDATTSASVTITSSSTTATVTHTSHGLTTGTSVTISGANESAYNGTFSITVTDTNTYTYTLHNSTSSPATGTIIAQWAHGNAPEVNTVISAYGRIWGANTETNKTTLYWSALLDGTDWSTGTAGELDISSILVYGNDEIIALGAHNGYLVVFCTSNIIIFDDADPSKSFLDPTNLQLVEVISGVGCIARDSVQNTGTDILFLSESGVRSLGRTIQEKSQPMRDISKNVRDDLVRLIALENNANIKSAYSESNAFYLLSFPTTNEVYCFDMRTPLQDGAARVTLWNNMEFTDWLGFDGEVYMTHNDGIAHYFGYTDNTSTYRMSYFTNYFDMGSPSQTKLLKRLSVTLITASGQNFTVKSGFDYNSLYTSYTTSTVDIPLGEYGVDEYNIAEYTSGIVADAVRIPAGGNGNVLQLGFETDINGGELSIQKIDVYVKQGRIL